MSPFDERPVNPLPPVVVALVLVLFGIELAFSAGEAGLVGNPSSVGWRLDALTRFAFSGEIMRWMIDTSQFPPEHMLRLVAYPFVHTSFTGALFAVVMLLAMGKIVAEALGPVRMLVVFFASAIGGAMGFSVTGDPIPLTGAFTPIFGLIGTFTFLLWLQLGQIGAQQSRAFTMIGVLMGVQLLFGLFFNAGYSWVADLCGFATGFALTAVLVPGGFARLIQRFRRD